MLKLYIFAYLCFTSIALDTCYKNIGNYRDNSDPILELEGVDVTLDECKSYCDTWDSDCVAITNNNDCGLNDCVAGTLTETSCILYSVVWEWYLESDMVRDQAFEECDPSCWVNHNYYQHSSTDQEIESLHGFFTISECQAQCEDYNSHCREREDGDDQEPCESYCYGVTSTETTCTLTIQVAVDDLELTDNDMAHYREFICDPTESSVDDHDGHGSLEKIDDSNEDADDEGEGIVEESVQGSDVCHEVTLYSECDFMGFSAVVDLEALELDWEPQSWCIPEHQTLVLHNAYFLGGEAATYTETTTCSQPDYTFIQKSSLKKQAQKKP